MVDLRSKFTLDSDFWKALQKHVDTIAPKSSRSHSEVKILLAKVWKSLKLITLASLASPAPHSIYRNASCRRDPSGTWRRTGGTL